MRLRRAYGEKSDRECENVNQEEDEEGENISESVS